MAVTVVTDSAATLPAEMAEELGVVVVPILILVGDQTVPDGTLSPSELVRAVGTVTTSGPSPGDFLSAMEGAEAALVITVAADLAGGTHLAARAAAAAADVPMTVVDSTTAAGAQGLVVLAAARAAAAGASLPEVEHAAREVVGRVRLVATIPGLEHLVRSGHVPEAAAWAGRWIGLQPLIEVRNGAVRPMRPALSRSAADDRMLRVWRGSRPSVDAALHLSVLHALDPDRAEVLLGAVVEEVEPVEAFVGSFGSAMILHSGPGVVGLAWWWELA